MAAHRNDTASRRPLSLLAIAIEHVRAWQIAKIERQHFRTLSRALRKNGNAWLVTENFGYGSATSSLADIGEALRQHFNSICREPLPVSFIELSRRIEVASA